MEIFTGNLPEGFRYVPQDNYLIVNPETANLKYLYSDSATSCIILTIIGKYKDGTPRVALAHLSRQIRYEAFFKLVEREFCGGISVYAQGANPPYPVEKDDSFSYDAVQNANILFKWIIDKTFVPQEGQVEPLVYIQQCTVAVGSGDPNAGYGAYGIDVDKNSKNYLAVSNKYFHIPSDIRDPEKGVQTLFCIFGIRTGIPSLILHNNDDCFTEEEKSALVSAARDRNWVQLLECSHDEILHKYSTTPEYEPCWFCDNLFESAMFVKNYKTGD